MVHTSEHEMRDTISQLDALILYTESASVEEVDRENFLFAERLMRRAEGYRRDLTRETIRLEEFIAVREALP